MEQKLIDKVAANYEALKPYCFAIYMGGSRVDPVIENPHDYDYICFAKPLQRHRILMTLHKLGLRRICSDNKKLYEVIITDETLVDLSQTRVYPYRKISWFSYLDVLMVRVIGDDVCPKTDIITEHRQEFFSCIYEKMNLLLVGEIRKQKRWYHLLRGMYILINKSYEVTDEQKKEINMLHDLSEGWEAVKEKTIKLIKEFKEQNNY